MPEPKSKKTVSKSLKTDFHYITAKKNQQNKPNRFFGSGIPLAIADFEIHLVILPSTLRVCRSGPQIEPKK